MNAPRAPRMLIADCKQRMAELSMNMDSAPLTSVPQAGAKRISIQEKRGYSKTGHLGFLGCYCGAVEVEKTTRSLHRFRLGTSQITVVKLMIIT